MGRKGAALFLGRCVCPSRRGCPLERLAGKRLLFVDDDPAQTDTWRLVFDRTGVFYEGVGSLKAALDRLGSVPFDCLVLDLQLPDSSGPETVARVRAAHRDLPIVVLTGTDDPDLFKECSRNGASDFLVKGRDGIPQLVRVVVAVVSARDRRRAEERYQALLDRYERALTEGLKGVEENRRLIAALRKETAALRRSVSKPDELTVIIRRLEQLGGADSADSGEGEGGGEEPADQRPGHGTAANRGGQGGH